MQRLANIKKEILKNGIVLIPLIMIIGITSKNIKSFNKFDNDCKDILINEVMADNLATIANENGNYSDWLEIYNPLPYEINLGEYYLSDEKNDLTKWKFPDIKIKANEYKIIFCDGVIYDNAEYLHTNFCISSDKENIYLSNNNNDIVDEVCLKNQECDVAYGYLFGDFSNRGFLPYSTPGDINPTKFSVAQKESVDWGEINFSENAGFYLNEIELKLSCENENSVILYTLDGSEPDKNAYIYDKPIKIKENVGSNKYVNKKNVSTLDNADIQYGVNNVYKGTVVRARILKDGILSSKIQTNTYFIKPHYSMPVVSLTTAPQNLFDEKYGSYVLGYTYYTLRKYSKDSLSGNFLIQSKMDGHIEIFENGGKIFDDDIEFKIAGGSSALGNQQKSFNISLDKNKINGSILGSSDEYKYKTLSLRGPGGAVVMENTYAYLNSFITNYIQDMDIDAQANKFCILFIDGEYWGVYNLCEPKGKDYIEQHYDIAKKDIDLVLPYENEFNDDFDELYYEVANRDFKKSDDYDWLKKQIDIKNFINFVFVEGYFANTDGIYNGDHNYYMWKVKDGLWRWQVFDLDCTFVDSVDYVQKILDFEIEASEFEQKKNFTMFLIKKVWNNDEFRKEYKQEVAKLIAARYSRQQVVKSFRKHCLELYPEMKENLKRCELDYSELKKFSFKIRSIDAVMDNFTFEIWQNRVNELEYFLENRDSDIESYITGVE